MHRFPRLLTAALGVFALAVAAVAAPGQGRAQIFNPETFTLDNGLQVVVVTNRRAPIVTQMLWYKVGSADEPIQKAGIAHILEHMMFKGTEKHPDGEFSDIVARNGGRENAFTSYDYTGYYQTVAKDRLGLIMELEADRMENLELQPEDVKTERQVVMEERAQRVETNPSGKLSEMANASLFLHHPYGTPIIGWKQTLETVSADDMQAFYERWYAPNNAVLVIAGDVTAEEVRPLAEKYYGPIPKAEVPDRDRIAEPKQNAPRRVELESSRVRQPSLSIRYLAPSYNTADDAVTPYALQLLSEVLGGGPTSRLYERLVVEDAVAVSAGSWYSPSSVDTTDFGFYISPRPDIDLAKAEQALRAEIETLLSEGVTKQEVANAIDRLRADAVYAQDDVNTAPRVIGQSLVTGRTVEDIEAWPQRISEVTPEQVEAAAKQVLDPDSSVTAVLKPEPTS
ncbi:M16 family metallopeptidase [Rhodovibrio salinarum]|uniref:Insulinase family protein n=1 Tax=Rhodovibrio salinarum TaxID=1087 RepID=A0A934V270_9PROT|nr:pitrilysin family protein [Rhodovibrio salinarum]MBK1699193.1 insulinase family protein [Rhodovibrio salinarum]